MISAKLFSDVRWLCAKCKEEDRVTAGAILQSVLVPISYCQSALSFAQYHVKPMWKEVKLSVTLLFLLPLNGMKICLLAQCDMDFVPIIAMLSPLPPSCKKPPSSYLARRKHGQSYQTGNISCSIMCKSLHGMQNLDWLTKPTSWKTFCSNIFAIISSSTASSDSQII